MRTFLSKNMKKYLPIPLIMLALALSWISATQVPHLLTVATHDHALVNPFDPKIAVIVSAKPYTTEESCLFLNYNLLRKKIQPIQIEIQNHTANAYSLCPSSIDLPLIHPDKVAKKILISGLPRSIALKIASLFFWPMMIPSTIEGIYSYAHHTSLKADYTSKSLKKEGEIISPYSTVYRIVFVAEDAPYDHFAIHLIDMDSFRPTTLHVTVMKIDQLIATFEEEPS